MKIRDLAERCGLAQDGEVRFRAIGPRLAGQRFEQLLDLTTPALELGEMQDRPASGDAGAVVVALHRDAEPVAVPVILGGRDLPPMHSDLQSGEIQVCCVRLVHRAIDSLTTADEKGPSLTALASQAPYSG